MFKPHVLSIAAFVALLPAAAAAQWGPQPRTPQVQAAPGYDEGYRYGVRAGLDDLRRGSAFNFSINLEFRRGDLGYYAQFGSRELYRTDFRRGFEAGYRVGYRDGRTDSYGADVYGRGRPGRPGLPPWANNGRAIARIDVATQQGYSDGYEAGLDDGRDGRRFDPISERRYRSADRGYNSSYGPRDAYRANYRHGFLTGYEAGYQDAVRYGRRW